ncbi:MAG: AAA family ATPase, partial [Bacteroidales bacterium]|nr:AAA family ATPase [Bacteroidales bacterium]
MGTYINIGNAGFRSARNGEYVDKSGLIAVVNATLETERRFSCVTRCRRFGKSMAAKMLNAYYDHSCDSQNLFADLEAAKHPDFGKHLNKHPVIYIDMTSFVTRFKEGVVMQMEGRLLEDLQEAYPDIPVRDGDDLMDYLIRVVGQTGNPFIFIIDEWDAICREFGPGTEAMDGYVNWLRRMFKDVNSSSVFLGVYMTGILPIKKYKTESALNNFIEYSMVTPRNMACYFGFTKDEVRTLSAKFGMDFDDLEKWYDGYQLGDEPSMFNPNSVMQALYSDWCESYWGKTGAYDAVSHYIKMNFEGLKDDVIEMLAGRRVKVNTTRFQNDLSIIETKDDALTVLIHLGYLSYDRRTLECYVPNHEVAIELTNAVEDTGWTDVIKALKQSEQLLRVTLDGDEEAVARGIEAAHDENTSILSYNNENSLACVLSIAYYYAKNDYVVHRELATGKGFA